MAAPSPSNASTTKRRFVMIPRRWATLSAICFLAAAYYLCYEHFPVQVTKDTPLYIATRNGKYGIVTTGGRIVVPFEWDDIGTFDDEGMAYVVSNQPPVHLNTSDPMTGETLDQRYDGIISRSGKVIIPATLTDSSWRFDEHGEFQGVRGQQLINFDRSGKEKWRSDWLPVRRYQWFGRNGLMAVRNGNETGWLDRTGKIVLRPPDGLQAVSNFDTAGLARVQDSAGRLGCMDEHGTTVIAPAWDMIRDTSRNPYRDGKWQTIGVPLLEVRKKKEGKANEFFDSDVGVCSHDGNVLIKAEYQTVSVYSDFALIVARQWDGLMGCFDLKGNLRIPFVYEDIIPWSETGLLAAKKGGKYGWINANGETVLPFDYGEVNPIISISMCPMTLAFASRDGRWGAINQRGETIVPFQYDRMFATFSSRHFIGMDDKTSLVFDNTGQPVGNPLQMELGSFVNEDEWLVEELESGREPGDGLLLFEAMDEKRMRRGVFHVEKVLIIPLQHQFVRIAEYGLVGRGYWGSNSFVDQYASFAKDKLNQLFPAIVPSDSDQMVLYDFDGNVIWRNDARLFDFLKAFGLSCWGLYCFRKYRVARREQRMLQMA